MSGLGLMRPNAVHPSQTHEFDEMTQEQLDEYHAAARAEHQKRVDDALHGYQRAVEECQKADRLLENAQTGLSNAQANAQRTSNELEHARRLLHGTIRGGFEGACFVKRGAKK